jgi:hypothetical protein
VRRRANAAIDKDFESLAQQYEKEFGRVLDPDKAKELFRDYARSPQTRALYGDAVSPAANKLVDTLFRRWIQEDQGLTPVIFTSGGPGTGKTTLVNSLKSSAGAHSPIIVDGALANLQRAEQNIRAARDAGNQVFIYHVDRPYHEAVHGVIDRALNPDNGRPVPVAVAAEKNYQARQTFGGLRQIFGSDPGVTFRARRFGDNGQILQPIPVTSVDAALPPDIDNWINHAYEILHEREAEARRAGAPLDREAYDALRSEGVRRQTGRHLGQHPGQLLDPAQDSQLRRGRGPEGRDLKPPRDEEGLRSAPFHLRRSHLKGRAVLHHLPDHVPATERECYALLRQAVAVYQNLYPALWRRFRRGSTSGRSGLETQFRDASGRITPESVRDARISVQEDKLARDLRGLSPRQTVFHMEHALGEEVRHLASLHAALALWEHSGTRLPLEPWLTGYFSHLWQRDFTSPLRTAILHAYAGNYGDPSRGNKMTYLPQDWQLTFEGLRMLSQARAGTLPTEADQLWHWPKHATYPLPMLIYFVQQAALGGKLSPRIEWMLHAMDQLMRVWHEPPAGGHSTFAVHSSGCVGMRAAA